MERHVASTDHEALEVIECALAVYGDVLVSARLAGHGTRKQWHLVSSVQQLTDLADAPPGTSLLVFLSRQLPIRGRVDGTFMATLADLADSYPEILVGVRERGRSELADGTVFDPVDPRCWPKLDAWLKRHAGEQAVAGPFPAAFAFDDTILTLVVPDADGRTQHSFY